MTLACDKLLALIPVDGITYPDLVRATGWELSWVTHQVRKLEARHQVVRVLITRTPKKKWHEDRHRVPKILIRRLEK